MSIEPVTLFWFRRDLRIDDNHGLARALDGSRTVLPIFIFDSDILEPLERDDSRVSFIHQAVTDLDRDLRSYGSRLHVHHGRPAAVFKKLFQQHKISGVVVNEDYEPYALKRDAEIAALAKEHGAEFNAYKDQVIFAKGEIAKDDGRPYRVFTPYARRWLARFETERIPSHPSVKRLEAATGHVRSIEKGAGVPSLKELGFEPSPVPVTEAKIHPSMVKAYAERRDFPAEDATTKIGVHLRFGTLSVRYAARLADKHSAAWLNELIWREFFQAVLFHFPETVSAPFDPRFRKFPWRDSAADFKTWRQGLTGYPIVDAGMRELNATGFMHNRARMIAGRFLCKHLLLDWRLGER
jgi:deoxyribodipyrimidine photo-lyase